MSVDELTRLRDSLHERLDAGWAKIEQGERDKRPPDTVDRWEDFWLDLLAEYEAICQQLIAKGVTL